MTRHLTYRRQAASFNAIKHKKSYTSCVEKLKNAMARKIIDLNSAIKHKASYAVTACRVKLNQIFV
ncbi:uncharacterized protein PHALS_15044 [Plasmopara halstedii]|uniref:Uncharacterized protein n=1 Tax=Plasmopara halstedii TaxID=4781 RepID=A0A0P1A7E1_PLAHL|nr:uncharacterized protein PHALS_15044 [Plasmopara halstedii]CEG36110.1 hypothetical protein PHALS_15044 [Plasmopara halstedii]|eukprot:XP_024572479.1 hypothetical protein PHALS_15044 [Plasmopara halstedii]